MLSVVVPVLAETGAVLETLAALVPAVADGVVRDVRLAATAPSPFLETICDGAGCGLVIAGGTRSALMAAAAAEARCAWVLALEPGLVPLDRWADEAADFAARSKRPEAAGFRLRASRRRGSGLRAFALNAQASLLRRGHPDHGLLAPREAWATSATALPFMLLGSAIQDRRDTA